MDALEAIFTRRSCAKVGPAAPSRADVDRLLEAAVRAPTHHLTEPWRFVVLAGRGLDDFGAAMAERVRQEWNGEGDLDAQLRREHARAHRAPVIVTVVYVPSSNPAAVEVEDRYSVGAAMQNILLAAHACGMGAYLRTGPAATDAGVARLLGLAPGEEVAGFVYLGWPADTLPPPTRRTAADERTTWLGWD